MTTADVGPRLVVQRPKASAVYYSNSQRIVVIANNFQDAEEALQELRMRVRSGEAEDKTT
jgi:hypothetical protein